MLVDPTFQSLDPFMTAVLSVVSQGRTLDPPRIERGLYRSYNWSFDTLLGDQLLEQYPELPEGAYGVVDSPEQFMAKLGRFLLKSPRRFVVSFVEIRRDEQSPEGGWRWHKWGDYIGDQKPTREYLYDEKDIDVVWTYHVYELQPRPELNPQVGVISPFANKPGRKFERLT